MILVCAVSHCKSNENTVINGEKVHFFPFPLDENIKKQWDSVCINVLKKNVKHAGPRVMCHLHFNKDCFESLHILKPDAVPTVGIRKRKPDFESNNTPVKCAAIKPSTVDNDSKEISEESSIQSENSVETKLQPYRLTIQIEKIFQRPCPKSKKNNQKITNTSISNVLMNHLSNDQQTIVKDENAYLCLVCKETFKTTSELHFHLKEHFTCDICRMEFLSQKSHKKHYEIHQSKNERYPYKCHVCNALFEKKEYIKTHNHIKKNMQKFESVDENRIQYCKSCHMTFRDEPTFRKHLNSHIESSAMNHLSDPLGL